MMNNTFTRNSEHSTLQDQISNKKSTINQFSFHKRRISLSNNKFGMIGSSINRRKHLMIGGGARYKTKTNRDE